MSKAASKGLAHDQRFGNSYDLVRKNRRLLYRNEETPLQRADIYEQYIQYTKDHKVSEKNIVDREDIKVIVDRIFQEIERSWIQNTAGIFLRHFGYFTVLARKRKTRVTAKMLTTRGHFYEPIFVPYEDDSDWKYFSMDYSIRRRIKTAIIKRAMNSFKYKNMLYTLKDDLRMSEKLLRYRDQRRRKYDEQL
jgi:nucleoid DNA-binding protein